MDEDLPAEYYEQIAREQAESTAPGSGSNGGSGSGGDPGIRICPHCTFENTHSGTDCEMCLLPLQ